MPFYINHCSSSFQTHDSQTKFYGRFILSIVLFQIVLVIALRVISSFKNYVLNLSQKELQQNLKKQIKTTILTTDNLNTEVFQTSHSILTNFKSGKSIHEKKNVQMNKQCNVQPTFESIVLKEKNSPHDKEDFAQINQFQNNLAHIKFKQNSKQPQCKSLANDEKKQNQDHSIEEKKDKSAGEFNFKLFNFQQQNDIFINIYNLKLSEHAASTLFNILLGHFFVAAVLIMQHSPTMTSASFAGGHCALLIVLLVKTMCTNDKNNKIQNWNYLKTLKNDNVINVDHHMNQLGNSDQNQIQATKTEGNIFNTKSESVKFRIFYLIASLMLFINLSLLILTVIRIKQSYYNIIEAGCQ